VISHYRGLGDKHLRIAQSLPKAWPKQDDTASFLETSRKVDHAYAAPKRANQMLAIV
jgi:hypothetical protein